MTHQLLASVDDLLAPAHLSILAGQPVDAVQRLPIQARYALSGSRLSVIQTNNGHGPQFILKQVSLAWDWQMRATDDRQCRSIALWRRGLLDRMPPEIEHGVLACAQDGAGWAILMRDYQPTLLPYARFSPEDNSFFLDAMAALHAAFFQAPDLEDPTLNLCRLRDVYAVFSPQTGWREAGGEDEIPRRILEGWTILPGLVPSDVADVTKQLVSDPQPLVDALSRYPLTLVHGDWRHANQGILRNRHSRLLLLDWQLSTAAPPAVEMGRCLATNSILLPVSKEDAIAGYRQRLAQRLGERFDEGWWRPQLALALLGGFVQDGWALALKATHWHVGADARGHWQADLQWWSEQVREGIKWL